MRLLFIRHGEPDYKNDRLTPAGRQEAAALAELAPSLNLNKEACFVSPLGRARETASYTMEKLGIKPHIVDWLEEFPVRIDSSLFLEGENCAAELYGSYDPRFYEDGTPASRVVWDMYPEYYLDHPELLDRNEWRKSAVAQYTNMADTYDRVTKSFDELLAAYGYIRNAAAGERYYRVEKENEITLTFFCHFAITSVLLSHLWNVSPFVLLQSTCLLPGSVTECVTEERKQGAAVFRTLRLGDTTHLTLAGIQPSFAARFCERYSNKQQRH